MLRDLDSRRAAESERQSLPDDVRPLPPPPRANPVPLIVGGVGTVVVLGGVVLWAPWKPSIPPSVSIPFPAVAVSPPAISGVPPQAIAPPATVTKTIPVPQQAPVVRVDQTGKDGKGSAVPSSTTSPVADKGKTRGESGNSMAAGRMDKSPALLSPTGQAESEYRRAQGLLAQGNASEAELALNQALRLAPEHAAARQALFALLVDLQRKDEAQSVLEAGLSILPGHSVWAMNIARLQMEKGDAAGAWETLQHSLGSAQNNGEYRAFCGTVLQRLGRPKDAIEHFHAALRINPGEGRWWLGLALVLESAGHPAEAREAYARAKGAGNLPADLAAFAEQKSRQP